MGILPMSVHGQDARATLKQMLVTLIRNRGRPLSTLDFAKLVVWINCGVPLAILSYYALRHRLGADPTSFAIRTTGMCALVFLSLSLVVTPLRKITGWNDAIAFRRTLGLYGFYYAAAHFLTFFIFDQVHDVHATASEIWTKRYLQIGFIGLCAMIPLAITSTNGMVRRLGPMKWHALHKLAYVAAIAGVVHFWMQVKSDLTYPKLFAWIIGALLAYRYVAMYFAPKPKAMKAASTAPSTAPKKKRFWSGELKVARVFDETPTVRTFRLTTLDGAPLPFDYMPGQYLNLVLEVDGKRVNRSYTIASSPTRTGNVEMTIKREMQGVSSRHLHDRIREGDVLKVSAPAGKFTFTGMESKRIVLIAAGVGITPLMSVVRYLTDTAWPGEIKLLFSAKSEDEIIFRHELETLASRHPNLHVLITLTQPSDRWSGPRGRISPELLRHLASDADDTLFHICGPNAMMDATRQMLQQIGIRDEQIKTEAFESRAATTEMPAGAVPAKMMDRDAAESESGSAVIFKKTAQTVPATDGKVILELAEDGGIDIPFDCRSGICGTCKVKLLAGEVEMDIRDALSADEEKDGIILTCQARPLGDVEVDA